jgi:hypothetical protein
VALAVVVEEDHLELAVAVEVWANLLRALLNKIALVQMAQ